MGYGFREGVWAFFFFFFFLVFILICGPPKIILPRAPQSVRPGLTTIYYN